MTKTIIIATGGTGGHIFPAQAIAKKLSQDGARAIILGDNNYAKYHKPQSSYQFQIISSAQFRKSPILLIKFIFKTLLAISQSLFWILKYKPKTIVAFGGYATFPVLVAALLLRKKIILHEQNAHLGKVNRIFAKFVDKVTKPFPIKLKVPVEVLIKLVLTKTLALA